MTPGLSFPVAPIAPTSPPGLDAVVEPKNAAKPPFKSPLDLTEAQRDKFQSECFLRISELKREMGLTETNDVIPSSFMWLRRCHEQYFHGDLTWRLAFGGIFLHSNITLGSGLRHCRYLASRVSDDLLGTTPFMGAMAVKSEKEELAKQVEEYVQAEIDKSSIRSSLREAQKIAIYRNECVVKTGYISDTTPYVGEATVLVDNQTGQPITTPEKGVFIYEDDDFIPHPKVNDLVMLESDPSFVIAANAEPGVVTIPADGETPERTGRYQYFPELSQVLVKKEGVYCDPIDYRSFLCPLRVKSIHDADTNVHLYLESPSRLQKIYGGIDVSQQYFTYWNQPGQDKPKYEQGETDQPTTAIYQTIVVAEVYRRCDPDETGEDKEIFAVLDVTNGKCIYYNYLANHMGKRPFESVPGVERVPGRWYGRGIYGMLDSHLFYEDVEASRSFFKNSQNATIQFAYKDAVADWKAGNPPIIGNGDTNWLEPNWNTDGRLKAPIWRENLASNFQPDVELMNTMRQSSDSLVGAISTQSANQSDFNGSKTATGNQLIQQASDVITKATEQDQTEAINDILKQVVDVALEHMDKVKLLADPKTGLLATINKHEARNLARDVRLLLTRSKSSQLLNTSAQALVIAKDYHALRAQSPATAKDLRPEYINQLKALEVQNGDTLCPDIPDEEVDQWKEAQKVQQQTTKPPSESISVKLADLVGAERTQALQKFGITADEQALQQRKIAEITKEQRDEPPESEPPAGSVVPQNPTPLTPAGAAVATA